jgi:hypothetical protein
MRFHALALFLLLGACVSPFHHAERVYTGVYAEGMETMTFRAEGRDETWSVASGGGVYTLQNAAPRVHAAERGPREPFSVRATVRGVVSAPGRYGHLGLFPREITITDVVEVHAHAN